MISIIERLYGALMKKRGSAEILELVKILNTTKNGLIAMVEWAEREEWVKFDEKKQIISLSFGASKRIAKIRSLYKKSDQELSKTTARLIGKIKKLKKILQERNKDIFRELEDLEKKLKEIGEVFHERYPGGS